MTDNRESHSGTITQLVKPRAPSGISGLDESVAPQRVINAIHMDDGSVITGPLVTYAGCNPLVYEGATLELTLFDPVPKDTFRDGSRPVMAIRSVQSENQFADDTEAIAASLHRVKKSIAMDVGNKWFIGAMIIMLGVFAYDLYGVLSGAHKSLNPESALWGCIAPLLLGRTLWYRRRLKQVERLVSSIADDQ